MNQPLVLSRLNSSDIANKLLEPVVPEEEVIAAVSAAPADHYEAAPEKPAQKIDGWYGIRAKLMGAYSVQFAAEHKTE
jgi:hypothetical protein